MLECGAALCGFEGKNPGGKGRGGAQASGCAELNLPGVGDGTESAEEIWRDYNGPATVEQRIEEMNNDLHADGFCTKKFFATETAFLGVVLSYNLLSLYQAQVTRQSGYHKPSTMRAAVFVGGVILGRKGREAVVTFSTSWGGLNKHIPLIKRIRVESYKSGVGRRAALNIFVSAQASAVRHSARL